MPLRGTAKIRSSKERNDDTCIPCLSAAYGWKKIQPSLCRSAKQIVDYAPRFVSAQIFNPYQSESLSPNCKTRVRPERAQLCEFPESVRQVLSGNCIFSAPELDLKKPCSHPLYSQTGMKTLAISSIKLRRNGRKLCFILTIAQYL